jgi:hypothetical protein
MRTQGAGKKLRAQANSQQRAGKICALLDDGDFVGEEGVFFFLIDANRAAQDDQQVAIGKLRAVQVAYADVTIMDLIAAGREDGFKGAQVFEVNMPNGRCGFHGERRAL